MKKITAEEQRNLRQSAKEELMRLNEVFQNEKITDLLDRFKNRFNQCETVYKVILAEHQKRKGRKKDGYLKVDMTQVPYALSFAGYIFEKEELNELFGSSSKKGMTVKKLRDAVTHGIDAKAAKEIAAREEELFGYMDSFLQVIQCFDDAA